MPVVSVIIPTFGRPSLLRGAIYSVLNSTDLDLEILVIDDNRKNDFKIKTKEVVSEFDSRVVKYLENERSMGGCGARNTGLINANSEFVAFLDDDDLMTNMSIEHRLDVIKDNADFVFGRHRYVDNIYGYSIDSPLESKSNFLFEDFITGYCPATTSALLVRKKAIIDCGMFSEELESYQDYDLWLRASRQYRIKKTDEIVVHFIQHSGDRVGVNIDKRLRALGVIVSKWESEISRLDGVKSFVNRMLYAAYMKNGKVLLSTQRETRKYAFPSFFKAFLLTKNKLSPIVWMTLSLVGFDITRIIVCLSKKIRGKL